MKFMVTWSIDQDKWIPVLEKWNSLTPEERADAAAVHRYLNQWNPHMDMDVAPVLDDEECTAAVKAILQDHAG
jgi:hypothetical protein